VTRVDRRSWQFRLGAILLLALVFRVIIVLTTPHFHTFNDSAQYDETAVSLARHGTFPASAATFHGGPTAYRPPLFPGVLAILYKIVGSGSAHDRWEWGRMLEAVLGALVVWLVFLIARRIWSGRVALVAAFVAALYPPLVLAGSSLLSESVFIPPMLAAVWAALVYRADRRLRWLLLAGAFIGLAALARGNGLELIVPVCFLVWVERPRRSWASAKAPLIVIAAMIAVLTPWTIRNFAQFHQFVPITTEGGYAVAGTYSADAQNQKRFPVLWQTPLLQLYQAYKKNPQINEEQASEQLTSDGLTYIKNHPFSVVKTVYWNTVRDFVLTPGIERYLAPYEGYPTWLAIASVYTFWLLTVLCLLALSRRVRGAGAGSGADAGAGALSLRAAPLALWGVPLVVYLTTVPWLGLTRYRVPADPILLLPATLVLIACYDRIAARAGRVRRDRVASAQP
jgi:4-amino-4-deoxy-L-arabinose transferase-like glycosyltransferase